MYSVLCTIFFVLYLCYCKRWGSHNAVYSLYRSSTRGPEDDSVESKHVAPISHYMFNITTGVFDRPSPTFIFELC